jgi:hypothetical protein
MSKETNITVNKGPAYLAWFVWSIAAGYAAYRSGLVNTLLAAAICGIIAFAVGYVDNKYAMVVILLAVAVFVITYAIPSRTSPTENSNQQRRPGVVSGDESPSPSPIRHHTLDGGDESPTPSPSPWRRHTIVGGDDSPTPSPKRPGVVAP